MADSDGKKVEPFKTELFGSPESTTGLGAGFDMFSSPFSLGPALGSTKEASASPSKLSSSSLHGSPGPGSTHTSRTGSPLPPKGVNHANTQDTPLANLDTIPLDSPDQIDGTLQGSAFSSPLNLGGEAQPSGSDVSKVLVSSVRKDQQGWNDPPSDFATPSRTSQVSSSMSSEDYQIQPLAPKLLDSALAQSSQSQTAPPPGRDAAGSNPYRIGSGLGSRKPAYGSSGIASFVSSSAVQTSVGSGFMVPPQSATGTGTVSEGPGQSQLVNIGGQGPPVSATPSVNIPSIITTGEPMVSGAHSVAGGMAFGYVPVTQHWFYLRPEESYWIPFSLLDSQALETAYMQAQDTSVQILVPTDGGRYDVDLHARKRSAVYWAEPESHVRRCSWFYKGEGERWYLPYDEHTAFHLEEQYKSSCEQSSWNKSVPLGDGGEYVLLHSQSSIVHYPAPPPSHLTLDIDSYHSQPKAVMRGFTDLDKVEAGEEMKVDYLVFVVHGIGAHYDLSFRSLVDCVDDFREVSQLMRKTHTFAMKAGPGLEVGESSREHLPGRVEYLPVHWHSKLHTSGVDERLKTLTLPSISRLRDFTNSTLLDILYFTSPLFCQTILSEVASEMNRMFEIFKQRNPLFNGEVSVMGHSLGSIILFDLLSNQPVHGGHISSSASDPVASKEEASLQSSVSGESLKAADESIKKEEDEIDGGVAIEAVLAQLGLENLTESFQKEQIDFESLLLCSEEDLRELNLGFGPRKKLSSYIKQQREELELVRQRRAEARERAQKEEEEKKKKAEEEHDDTDSSMSMVYGAKIMYGPAGTGQTYVQYPRLLFTPRNLFAVGSPIGLFLTVRGMEELGPEFMLPTKSNVFNIYHPFDPVAYRMEPLISGSAPERGLLMPHHKGRKRFHLELYDNLGTMGASIKQHLVEGMRNMWQQLNELARSHTSSAQSVAVEDNSATPSNISISDAVPSAEHVQQERDWLGGAINQGRRVDHVLQEKPIEKLNEYLFALSSHLCYWRSEDTALFLLKEVYSSHSAPSSS